MSPQNFLDSLENLRVVTSVALEHFQDNRDAFVKSATGAQVRQADKTICSIRVLNVQLEREFIILEYVMGEGSAAVTAQLKFGKLKNT
jgi:hypothetical protein